MYSAFRNDENTSSHDVLHHQIDMIESVMSELYNDDEYHSEFNIIEDDDEFSEPVCDQIERQIENLEKRQRIVNELIWVVEAFYKDTQISIDKLQQQLDNL